MIEKVILYSLSTLALILATINLVRLLLIERAQKEFALFIDLGKNKLRPSPTKDKFIPKIKPKYKTEFQLAEIEADESKGVL